MNKIREILGIHYPIVQAAMSWITNAEMVAAVSNAGGLGILGPNAGDKSLSTEERYRKVFQDIKVLTDKPFGVNIYSPNKEDKASLDYAKKILRVAFEENVKIFLLVGTVNREIFELIKKQDGIIVHRELTPTAELAKRAEEEAADILVATGYDEGGWLPKNKIETFSIVPVIADAVSIPVLAAGGINDIRGVRAAFVLGAQGVYVGTRFITSKESPAHETTKKAILSGSGRDLVFVSATQRSLSGEYAIKLAKTNSGSLEEAPGLKEGMLEGRFDKGIATVNTAIDLITETKSCQEIVQELMADFIE